MKDFDIKVFGLDGTFKKNIPASYRKNDITFSSNINGGQGQCNIELNFPIDEALGFGHSDMIKIYAYNDTFPTGKMVYTGQIQIIEKQYTENSQSIILTCFGLATLLRKVIFKSGVNFVFTKNEDPATTIKSIIDYFNTIYTGGWLSYTTDSIINYGNSINTLFTYMDCLTAITNLANTATYFWYINQDGLFIFQPIPVSASHFFTTQKDLQSLNIKETSEQLVNNVYIHWRYTTDGYSNVSDGTSEGTYGQIDKLVDRTDLQSNATGLIAGATYITDNKDKKISTSLVVNDRYNYNGLSIEDINPGDSVTILNSPESLVNLQIQRITYNSSTINIDLDDYFSLGKVLYRLNILK